MAGARQRHRRVNRADLERRREQTMNDLDAIAAAAGLTLTKHGDGTWIAADDAYELAVGSTPHAALCTALAVLRERYRRLRRGVTPLVLSAVIDSAARTLADIDDGGTKCTRCDQQESLWVGLCTECWERKCAGLWWREWRTRNLAQREKAGKLKTGKKLTRPKKHRV
jgi:hypothetical protein